MQAGEVLVADHLQEGGQVVGREADEVQVPRPAAQRQVLELQVDVADARLPVRRVGGQVSADALEVLHLLLLLLRRDVLRLEVDQLHQGAADVHPEPGERCGAHGGTVTRWGCVGDGEGKKNIFNDKRMRLTLVLCHDLDT